LQECVLPFRQHLGRYGKVVDIRKQNHTVRFHDLVTVHRLFRSFQLLGFDDEGWLSRQSRVDFAKLC
jgi:hypothetical protein